MIFVCMKMFFFHNQPQTQEESSQYLLRHTRQKAHVHVHVHVDAYYMYM